MLWKFLATFCTTNIIIGTNAFLRILQTGINRSKSIISTRRETIITSWVCHLRKLSMSKIMLSAVDKWMDIDHWWNDRERGELGHFKRKYSHFNYYYHKFHGLNPVPCDDGPSNNGLSDCPALIFLIFISRDSVRYLTFCLAPSSSPPRTEPLNNRV